MDAIDENELLRGPRYAGVWIRLGAYLIDGVCLIPLTLLGTIYNNTDLKSLPLAIAITIVTYLYKLLMEYRFGATLGKMAVKLKVVNSDQEKISLGQAFSRTIPWLIGSLIGIYSTFKLYEHKLFAKAHTFETVVKVQSKVGGEELQYVIYGLFVLIAVTIGVDSRHQGFHDKTAGTFVVKK